MCLERLLYSDTAKEHYRNVDRIGNQSENERNDNPYLGPAGCFPGTLIVSDIESAADLRGEEDSQDTGNETAEHGADYAPYHVCWRAFLFLFRLPVQFGKYGIVATIGILWLNRVWGRSGVVRIPRGYWRRQVGLVAVIWNTEFVGPLAVGILNTVIRCFVFFRHNEVY